MSEFSEDQFGKGAIKSVLDERDYQWEEVAMGIAPFDWTAGYDIEAVLGTTIKPKDQGSSSSCGGQAWATLAAVQEAIASESFEERSAKFVYAQTFVSGGGSGGRENSEIYSKRGVAVETLCTSYMNGKPPTEAFMERSGDITAPARANALNTTHAGSYVSVSPDIESIARAIKQNGGVVIGIDGSNNRTWLSEFPQKPVKGEGIWRHWLYAGKAKTIKGVKYIGVLNSWGTAAGKNGWQWISEDYIKSTVYDASFAIEQACVWEAWTCVVNTTGVPTTFSHNFIKDIAYGQKGDEVRALQMALQADGTFPIGFSLTAADYPVAYYGDMTAQAILKFRVKYGIDSSTDPKGKSAGPRTRAKLNELYNK